MYLTITWAALLLLGAFPILAAIGDLAADLSAGIPSDHRTAFATVAGTTWVNTLQAAPGTAHYITLLEYGYAVHELVLGVLFLTILVIPFRQGRWWAWFACWSVLVANVVYSLTFGRYDAIILRQSLIADIALPVLLLAQLPRFVATRRPGPPGD